MKAVKRYSVLGSIIIVLALVLSGCGSSCDDPSIDINGQTWSFSVTQTSNSCYTTDPGLYDPFSITVIQNGSTFSASSIFPQLDFDGKICGDEVWASGSGIVYGGIATSTIRFTVTGASATGKWNVDISEIAIAANSDGALHAAAALPPPDVPCSLSADLVGSNAPN